MTELKNPEPEAQEPDFAEPDPVAYNAFVERIQLDQIEVARILAERVAAGDSVESSFETRFGFLIGDRALHWRFDCEATVLDAEGAILGTIEAAVIITTAYEGEPPTPDMMARFGNTSAVLMAHPYLREVIAGAAQRIGLPNVLLPMVRR